jgi:alpha-glucosidase
VRGRDGERVPLPWAGTEPPFGFTTGTPWLPPVADAEELAVAAQREDPRSTLALHRRIIDLRRRAPALHGGDQRLREAGPGVLAWTRSGEGEEYLVAINMGTGPARAPGGRAGRLVLSSDPDREENVGVGAEGCALGADEAMLVHLEGAT